MRSAFKTNRVCTMVGVCVRMLRNQKCLCVLCAQESLCMALSYDKCSLSYNLCASKYDVCEDEL